MPNYCIFCGKNLNNDDWEDICRSCEEVIKINDSS